MATCLIVRVSGLLALAFLLIALSPPGGNCGPKAMTRTRTKREGQLFDCSFPDCVFQTIGIVALRNTFFATDVYRRLTNGSDSVIREIVNQRRRTLNKTRIALEKYKKTAKKTIDLVNLDIQD